MKETADKVLLLIRSHQTRKQTKACNLLLNVATHKLTTLISQGPVPALLEFTGYQTTSNRDNQAPPQEFTCCTLRFDSGQHIGKQPTTNTEKN